MMQMEERVKHLFGLTLEIKMAVADALAEQVAKAGQRLVDCLLNEGTVFICGNGGSSANCMHFSSAMLNHFEVERPSLPVINLCADSSHLSSFANENHYNQAFARSIHALGKEQDVLLMLTTTGNSDSLLYAVQAASERGMDTVALSGRDGGVLSNHLGPEDIELLVPVDNSARIREVHLFILHCFCDLIDQSLFSQVLG